MGKGRKNEFRKVQYYMRKTAKGITGDCKGWGLRKAVGTSYKVGMTSTLY